MMRHTGTNLKKTVNTLTVSYHDYGAKDAPVLLFIHGFPFNKSMWSRQVESLSKDFRVITYDIRGHGNSEIGRQDYSIDLFTADLIGLMDALELEKAAICGLSLGGYIALNAIESAPDRFNALILCDTQCIADTAEMKQKRLEAIRNIMENGVEKYAEELISHLFAPESFATKIPEIDAVRKMITRTSKKSLCNTLHALSLRKETCSRLSEIEVPVLIIVGKEDKITPPAAARLMHEKIQGSTLSIIEGASHLTNLENPQKFNFQLHKFMHQFAKSPFSLSPVTSA